MNKKLIYTVILLILVIITFIGCSKFSGSGKKIYITQDSGVKTEQETIDKEYVWAGLDTSEDVTMIGYLIGEAPQGLGDVLKVLNTKLKEKVNATLEIRYLSWADYKTKYPLILAAGEDVDFVYTADWCMYAQEATKNAFYEIKQEDLEKYMPRHYANCNPKAYEQANINDKMYMITTSTPDVRVTCLAYRKDLAKKYGITNLNKLSDFTPYFKRILENETDIAPMSLAASYDAVWQFLANEYDYEINISNGLCFFTEENEAEIGTVYEAPYVDSLTYAFRIMKEWYDAGYVNKDVLPNETASRIAFMEGKSAIALGNSVDLQSVLATCKDKGYDVGIIPLLDSQGKTTDIPYINNGAAISSSSKNPERTMMVLDLLMEEKEFNYLVYFGIQGKNYVITDDGKIGLPSGVTDETNTYPVDAAGFWFTNKSQHLPLATWTEDYINLKMKIPSMLHANRFNAFSQDLSNIQTETADISLVTQQYMQPLCFGMVDDVDKAMLTLKEKLIIAGIDRVKKVVEKQMAEYKGY